MREEFEQAFQRLTIHIESVDFLLSQDARAGGRIFQKRHLATNLAGADRSRGSSGRDLHFGCALQQEINAIRFLGSLHERLAFAKAYASCLVGNQRPIIRGEIN